MVFSGTIQSKEVRNLTQSVQFSSESQTDKLTTGDTYTFIIYHLFTTNYELLQANQNSFEYLTSIYSLTVFENYAVRFTLNESVFMTNYI